MVGSALQIHMSTIEEMAPASTFGNEINDTRIAVPIGRSNPHVRQTIHLVNERGYIFCTRIEVVHEEFVATKAQYDVGWLILMNEILKRSR